MNTCVPATGAGRGQLPAPQAPVTATPRGAARPSSPPAPATATSQSSPPAPARPPARPRRLLLLRPASGTARTGHGHVQGGSASVLAAGAGHGQRSLSSLLFAVVAVPALAVVAIPAGGARHGHVCVGLAGVEILQRGTCRKHIR